MPPSILYISCLYAAHASVPEITSNIRSEYIQGQPIAVQIIFRNQDDTTLEIPNIEMESWRIEFQIKDSKGQKQTRSTRPDEAPPPSKWTIKQRQSRSLWVELPAGQGLKPDQYTFSFSIDLDGENYQSPDFELQIQKPNPIATDLTLVDHPLSHQNNPNLWTHQGMNGYSTYLHIGHTNHHGQTLFHDFVFKTDAPHQPKLSIAQNGTRHILWQQSPKQIQYLTLQNNVPRHQIQQLAVPWPAAEMVGSPVSAPNGTPQFLLWVPSPSEGGELRWCSVMRNGIPIYRKLTQLDHKPRRISISMNDRGEALIALMDQMNLLLFTAIEANERPNIPLKGEQLLKLNEKVVDHQFSVHPDEGQVLQLLTHQDNGEWAQVTVSLNGENLTRTVIGNAPFTDKGIRFSAHHTVPAITIGEASPILYANGNESQIQTPNIEWTLDRDQEGALWIIGSSHTRPAYAQKLPVNSP